MRISDWSSDVCSSDLEEPGLAIDHQDGCAPHHQRADGSENGELGADQIVDPGEGDCPEAGSDVQQDAENEDVLERHAESAGGIDAAEGKESVESIGIKHAGKEELPGLLVVRQQAQRAPQ